MVRLVPKTITRSWRAYACGYVAGVGAFVPALPGALRIFLIAWSLVTMLVDDKKDEGTP